MGTVWGPCEDRVGTVRGCDGLVKELSETVLRHKLRKSPWSREDRRADDEARAGRDPIWGSYSTVRNWSIVVNGKQWGCEKGSQGLS